MPTPPRFLLGLFALLAASPALAAAPGDAKYLPQLTPHFSAGQLFSYSADADYMGLFNSIEHMNHVNDDGTNKKSDKTLFDSTARYSALFAADTVLARQVYKNGSLREAVFLVTRCQVKQEHATLASFIPAGTILAVSRRMDGQFAFTLEGKPATTELAAELQQVDVLPKIIPPGSMLMARKQNNGQVAFALDGRSLPPDKDALLQEKDIVQDLIPPGSVLAARKQKDGQVAFAVNGVAADPVLAERLSLLIELGNEDATKDDLLSPSEPKAVGEAWDVNLKAVLNSDLPECFPGLSSVIGNVQMVSVRNDKNGHPLAVIGASYSLVGVQPPFKRQFKADTSTVSFKVVTTTPANGGPGQYDLQLKSFVRHAAHTGDENVGFASSSVEFNITIEQNIHIATDVSRPTVAALANAPAVPDAPPLPPGLSASNVYRPPVEWLKKTGQPPTPVAGSPTPAPTPAVGTLPGTPAPQPKPAANTAPFIMPDNDISPFNNAQDPLLKPASPK